MGGGGCVKEHLLEGATVRVGRGYLAASGGAEGEKGM